MKSSLVRYSLILCILLAVSGHIYSQVTTSDDFKQLPFTWRENDEAGYQVDKKYYLVKPGGDSLLLEEYRLYVEMKYREKVKNNHLLFWYYLTDNNDPINKDSLPLLRMYPNPYIADSTGKVVTLHFLELEERINLLQPFIYKKRLGPKGRLEQPVADSLLFTQHALYLRNHLYNDILLCHSFYNKDYSVKDMHSYSSSGFNSWFLTLLEYDHQIKREILPGYLVMYTTRSDMNKAYIERKLKQKNLSPSVLKELTYASKVINYTTGNFLFYRNGLLKTFVTDNVIENGKYKIIERISFNLK